MGIFFCCPVSRYVSSNLLDKKRFWPSTIILSQQIPERLPILQATMASFTASIWRCDVISSVSGALVWTTLCHVWAWHGAAGCVFSHKAHACPRCASCLGNSTQTDKWWDNIDFECRWWRMSFSWSFLIINNSDKTAPKSVLKSSFFLR